MNNPMEMDEMDVSTAIRPSLSRHGDAGTSIAMKNDLLTTKDAAGQLGISTASLYDWLAQSNAGTFVLRGQPVTIDYLQGGRKGQGRIKLEPREIERLKDLMRVRPRPMRKRKPPTRRHHYPGITVELGDVGG
ncbi:MAG: DNA-binding protein [Planctomycetota bacterium]|nr:DNA-binding protein [Planctomycetota bacterium]